MTSTWHNIAEARAIARERDKPHFLIMTKNQELTESGSKRFSGVVQIILKGVVGETKSTDKQMKEYEYEEEHPVTTLIDHPQFPPLNEVQRGLLDWSLETSISVCSLETL